MSRAATRRNRRAGSAEQLPSVAGSAMGCIVAIGFVILILLVLVVVGYSSR